MKKTTMLFMVVFIVGGLLATSASTASATVINDPEIACDQMGLSATDYYYDPATQTCYWKYDSKVKPNKCWPMYDIYDWVAATPFKSVKPGGYYKFSGCGYSPGSDGGSRMLTLKDFFSSGNFKFPGAGKFAPDMFTCAGKCTVKSGLKSPAKSYKGNLPGKYKSGAYVKILDKDGNPTTGSFRICLSAKGAKNPQIFKYTSGGHWSLVGGGLTADGKKVCTWADTSGNYAVADLP